MFKLGCLQTEQQHPNTIGLSDLAKNDLPAAIARIKDLDVITI
jgi:N-acetylmuramic acid 6-phosphate etherase